MYQRTDLERRLDLAKRAVRLNVSLPQQKKCWEMVQETALDENNEQAFDLASAALNVLCQRQNA